MLCWRRKGRPQRLGWGHRGGNGAGGGAERAQHRAGQMRGGPHTATKHGLNGTATAQESPCATGSPSAMWGRALRGAVPWVGLKHQPYQGSSCNNRRVLYTMNAPQGQKTMGVGGPMSRAAIKSRPTIGLSAQPITCRAGAWLGDQSTRDRRELFSDSCLQSSNNADSKKIYKNCRKQLT